MWTPQNVTERIANGSLLPDSMFESLKSDILLDQRDSSCFDDDWVRAAEALQPAWDHFPEAQAAASAIDIVRELAFKRTFNASGGNPDLAAAVSDDFELICRQVLLGVESPFITALKQAYEAYAIPH